MKQEIIFKAFQTHLVNTKRQAFDAAYCEGIFDHDLILACFSEWISDEEF